LVKYPQSGFQHFFREPGVNSRSIEITQDSEWVRDYSFCTKNENLQKYMGPLTVEFLINDAPLEEGSLRTSDKPGIKDWLCRNWPMIHSGWPAGRHVFPEIHFTHSRQVSDGRAVFPAGEYSQLPLVVVRG
jgi:hypothetical protein